MGIFKFFEKPGDSVPQDDLDRPSEEIQLSLEEQQKKFKDKIMKENPDMKDNPIKIEDICAFQGGIAIAGRSSQGNSEVNLFNTLGEKTSNEWFKSANPANEGLVVVERKDQIVEDEQKKIDKFILREINHILGKKTADEIEQELFLGKEDKEEEKERGWEKESGEKLNKELRKELGEKMKEEIKNRLDDIYKKDHGEEELEKEIENLSEDLKKDFKANCHNVINFKGELLNIRGFSETDDRAYDGWLRVRRGNEWNFINRYGGFKTKEWWLRAQAFQGGRVKVWDKNGNVTILLK